MSDGGRRVLLAALCLLAAGCGVRQGPPVPEVTAGPSDCSVDGVHFGVTGADAASGLRVLTLVMENCGTVPLTVEGYPRVRLFDEDGAPVTVAVRRGAGEIATLPAFDAPPAEVTLRPGEQAHAGMVWRNLVTDATVNATTAHRLRASAGGGKPWQDVPLVLPDGTPVTIDLGDTGELGTQPWVRG